MEGPDIRACVFDLDGTLLDPDKRISQRTQAALDRLRAKGFLAVFATARLPRAVRGYGLERWGVTVWYNGALYRPSPRSSLVRSCLGPEAVAEMHRFVTEREPAAVFSVERDDRWLTRVAVP